MFRVAQNLTYENNMLRSFLLVVGTPGSESKKRPFRFLQKSPAGDRTLDRYAKSARGVVTAACKAVYCNERYETLKINGGVMDAVKRYMNYCDKCDSFPDDDDDTYQRLLFDLLHTIFFEELDYFGGGPDTFCQLLYTSLCTTAGRRQISEISENWSASQTVAAGISTANVTSASLCGIMYCVSCIGILRLLKYFPIPCSADFAYRQVKQALSPGAKHGYSILVDLRTLCSSLRPFELPITPFIPCTNTMHGVCGFVKGKEFSTKSIGNTVKRLQTEVAQLMFEDLLCNEELPGGSISSFRNMIDSMADDVANKNVGYSALADPRNVGCMEQCSHWRVNFVSKRGLNFNINSFSRTACKVLSKLLSAAHLCGGGVARSTELGSYIVRNTALCQRNVFFLRGEVLLATFYDKRSAVMEGKVPLTSRHLDPETSFLLKAYMILLRPLVIISEEAKAHPENVSPCLRDQLSMGLIDEKKLSRTLSTEWTRHGLMINFSLYRHLATGLWKVKCERENNAALLNCVLGLNRETGDDIEEEDDAADLYVVGLQQSNHSARTAKAAYAQLHIGEDKQLCVSNHLDRIELNRRVSHIWQVECGLRKSETQLKKKTESRVGNAFMQQVGQSDGSIVTDNDSDLEDKLPKFRKFAWRTRKQNLSLPNETCIATDEINIEHALRAAISNRATWKSDEQRIAMEEVVKGKTDVLVAIGTGGGKTATVLGPVLYERGFSVWFSPLRALRLEIEARLLSKNVFVCSVHNFDIQRRTAKGNVLLVSPEHTQHPMYKNCIDSLLDHKALNRFITDEAHLVLLSESFRPCMSSVRSATKYGAYFPIVMLTATAPPSLTNGLLNRCGSTRLGATIIRGDPSRPNLKFSVQHLSDGTRELLKQQTVQQVSNMIRNEKNPFRCIIYCLTIDDVKEVHSALHEAVNGRPCSTPKIAVGHYFGPIDDATGKSSLHRWYQKDVYAGNIMVATDAFGCGIDVPNVRMVLMAGGSRSLIDFWQQAGRAGRDGLPAKVQVLYHRSHLNRARASDEFGNIGEAQKGDFRSWVENRVTCRRIQVEQFLGKQVTEAEHCSQRQQAGVHTELCNVCDTGRRICGTREFDAVYETEEPESTGPERPLEHELAAVKRRKVMLALQEKKDLEWLRYIARKLDVICVYHICRFVAMERFNLMTDDELLGVYEQALSCSKSCDEYRRCKRCEQKEGHYARDCPHIASRFSKDYRSRNSEFRCGGCYLHTVNSVVVHAGMAEVGSSCPFASCIKLCLVCYSNESIRKKITDPASPYEQDKATRSCAAGSPVTDKVGSFFRWLTEDSMESPAGIIRMLKYLVNVLDLSQIGVN